MNNSLSYCFITKLYYNPSELDKETGRIIFYDSNRNKKFEFIQYKMIPMIEKLNTFSMIYDWEDEEVFKDFNLTEANYYNSIFKALSLNLFSKTYYPIPSWVEVISYEKLAQEMLSLENRIFK